MIPIERWSPADGLALEPNALKAVKETKRNLVLTAGPGAGKTEMLAQRADFLLRTGSCRYPKRILAISFKVDACQNLKLRVRKRCGPELSARLDSQTFHAFAKRLIDRFRPVLKGVNALDVDYSIADRRVHGRSITFSDMVPLAHEIIEKSHIAKTAIQQTYSHVFLDEFQDCTREQYDLIKTCFMGTPTIVTAVGDTKQRIMGWAGALEGVFQIFAQDFAAIPLNLYQNFRSAPNLRRMQNGMVKVMDPPAALIDADIVGNTGEMKVLSFPNDEEEADALAQLVKKWITVDGILASEIAILVSKQQNLYCQSLIAAFKMYGIPYREEDAIQDLASEPIACFFIDFLLVACGTRQSTAYRRLLDIIVFNNGFDEEREYQARSRWDRFLNETRVKISEGVVNLTLRQDIDRLGRSLVEHVGRANLVALSMDYAQGDRLDQLIDSTISRTFELLRNGTEATTALESFSGDRAVRILSIHKSKGLEFDSVILLGVESETFWGNASAERSAYFVGVSRAKHRLILTVCEHRKRPEGAPHRWTQNRTPHEEFLSYAL